MIKIIYILAICFSAITIAKGQDKIENVQYGFSMQAPPDWIESNNEELLKNLGKLELSDEELTKFLKDHKGSVLLGSFYKYDPATHAGLIPTIQVNVRANPSENFDAFTNLIELSANSMEKYFKAFDFLEEPKAIEISGKQSIYFVCKFNLPTQSGELMKVKSRTYAIPYGKYFFQLNFTDAQSGEDNSKLFDQLIKTVVVGKE